MNKELLQTWLRDPQKMDGDSHKELKALIDKYPYYQAPYLLLLKTLNQQKSIRFNQELKNSALFIPDRRRLYLYINDKLELPTYKSELTVDSSVKTDVETKNEDDIFTLDDQENDALISSSLQINLSESDQPEENLVESKGEIIDFDDLESDVSDDVPDEAIVENQKISAPESKDRNGLKSDCLSIDSEIYDMDFGGNLYVLNSVDKASDDQAETNENHSFLGWMTQLASSDVKPVQIVNEKEEKASSKKKKLNKNSGLISDFIENEPRIPKPNEKPVSQVDISKGSLKENEGCMSETLADIYIKQKLFDKAEAVYQKLMLKNPEKNIYFASQLKRIAKFKK
ncbi:MAG: hypothetical protein ACI93S_000305 [Ancylomarina sp.]|jgi:hypothetical protein